MGTPFSIEACARAAEYSSLHEGLSLVVQVNGHLVFEHHAPGVDPDQPHDLASGTKSFAGVLAAAAAADGLLQFDEPVVDTIEEWRADPVKSRITIRQLLLLVSGLAGGSKPGHIPEYEEALLAPAVSEPGLRFHYANAPFQVFGEVMRRKLRALVEDPLVYLQARILDPTGLRVGRWRRGRDGQPSWASGASLTAREWVKLGELVRQEGRWSDRELIPSALLRECFQGSADNPAYGLSWWLNAPLPQERRSVLRQATLGLDDLWSDPWIARDLVYAAGAAKQRLYVSREQGWVVARQAGGVHAALARGEHSPFSDREFLGCLLDADVSPAAAAVHGAP